MRELSLHILDLAQNSVEAGARNLQIDIDENENGFMDMVTSQCGGYFDIKSQPGEGTVVKAAFKADNIDRPPLGDIAGSIAVLLAGAPAVNLVFNYKAENGAFCFDTRQVREVLGQDTDFAHPEIYRWTEEYLRQQLGALHAGQEE